MTRNKLLISIVTVLLIIIGGIIGLYILKNRTAYGIPETILQKPAFTVFSHDPTDSTWEIQSPYSSYDMAKGLLTLHFINNDNKLTLNEQVTPGTFTDIPAYYPTLLSKLREYAEIQTPLGTVALTHPVELKGGQSAVINTQGTLMFAHPDKGLSQASWQEFFNTLRKVH